MPLTKDWMGLRDSGQFKTALERVERYFVGVIGHPVKMPIPMMINRMIGQYSYAIFQGIDGAEVGQVIKAHKTAFDMMARVMKVQIIPGQNLLDTLVSSIKGSQSTQVKLFNLTSLGIIFFPLYYVYSLVPEHVFAGQSVLGYLQKTSSGKRASRNVRVETFNHEWNASFGIQSLRLGRPGLVQSLSFYRWFVKFFQDAKLQTYDDYISILESPKNKAMMQKMSVAALQFLSVTKLRSEGGIAPSQKKPRSKEL